MRRVFLALLRIAIGVVFIGAGVRKLSDRDDGERELRPLGPPGADDDGGRDLRARDRLRPAVLLGLATRLGALILCLDMLGAVATAGRVDGGVHLVAPPVLALLCLVLVARGGGRWQLLDRVDPPR